MREHLHPSPPSQRRGHSPMMVFAAIGGLILLVHAPATGQRSDPGPTQDEIARAVHLLSRATWGIRPANLDALLASGPEAWLERQLHPERIDDRALDVRLEAYPTARMSILDLYRGFSPQPAQGRPQAPAQGSMRETPGTQVAQPAMTPEERRMRQARNPARLLNELVGAKIQRAVSSERQLEDVMTDFWFNHFNVFFGKGQVRFLVADYERTAIRPHVFGRFEDMLLATAQHPAMLFYLDNWQSVHVEPAAQPTGDMLRRRLRAMSAAQKEEVVRSGRLTREQLDRLERGDLSALPAAQRIANRGLNENYARELLELHTLGVDGGYTEGDVVAVARAFTGWGFLPPMDGQPRALPRPAAVRGGRLAPAARGAQAFVGPGDVPFVFRPDQHDRDEKTVLGQRLRGGRGLEDGRDVIRLLARHPSTARHLATKLVERFVSDVPPLDLVDHLATVFLETDGDLRAVTRALFTADDFDREDLRGIKVKTPFELVVSALRATGADVQPSPRIVALLRTMGHLPYSEPAPTGYPAASDDWVNAGAMLHRINLALELASGRLDGIRPDLAALAGPAPGQTAAVETLLATVLPGHDTTGLADRIREDLDEQDGLPPRQRLARTLGLALGSPEFQRR